LILFVPESEREQKESGKGSGKRVESRGSAFIPVFNTALAAAMPSLCKMSNLERSRREMPVIVFLSALTMDSVISAESVRSEKGRRMRQAEDGQGEQRADRGCRKCLHTIF
jgi:hypothetical protein